MLDRKPRQAFTLVELLVVIAIIGILVALLLPAVNAAREAARRTSCSNNMRNIALAIHNFHTAQSRFPYSIDFGRWPAKEVDWTTGVRSNARPHPLVTQLKASGRGWLCEALPYMEEQALYDELSAGFDGNWYALKTGMNLNEPRFRQALTQQVSTLQCPSDSSAGPNANQAYYKSASEVPGAPIVVSTTNYKGVAGDTVYPGNYADGLWNEEPWGRQPDCHDAVNCTGIFWRYAFYRPVRLKSVRDGTSKTLMVGESVVIQDGNSAAFFSDSDWASTNMQLNFVLPGDHSNGISEWWNVRGFRSTHPGGVTFALVDASVGFVGENIDHEVYRAMSTRGFKEQVSTANAL